MTIMKVISVSEATGPALDWLVAKCEGLKLYRNALLDGQVKEGWWVSGYYTDQNNWIPLSLLNFSTDWTQAGPIIDRMFAQGLRLHTAEYMTGIHDKNIMVASLDSPNWFWFGPTPLIAAMRCYVGSKLGKTVEVPEELLN